MSWDDAGSEAEPSPTAWLEELDLVAEGLAALQEPSEQQDAAAAESSLSRVREVLLQHAGEPCLLPFGAVCVAKWHVNTGSQQHIRCERRAACNACVCTWCPMMAQHLCWLGLAATS